MTWLVPKLQVTLVEEHKTQSHKKRPFGHNLHSNLCNNLFCVKFDILESLELHFLSTYTHTHFPWHWVLFSQVLCKFTNLLHSAVSTPQRSEKLFQRETPTVKSHLPLALLLSKKRKLSQVLSLSLSKYIYIYIYL